MGVKITYSVPEKEHDITPGSRSFMYQLLLENGLLGSLDKSDIPLLLRVGREQHKDGPADRIQFSDEIQTKCQELARAIRKHGRVIVEAHF